MRLHTLTVHAFGPYAAGQVIDFTKLTSSGLFLLEGPTGAGKTTILDAITYALYGGLAGEEPAEDRLRSHFAAPGAEPRATLEFSVRGTRYRISRVPEHRRPKRRGDGFTVEKMQVHLERLTAGGWQSLSHNKAEVAEEVIEAVGLTRAQFTQVMLLPQGEFARFLRCGDDDRRALLTKLFGTELYDRITTELDRRRAAASRARQEHAEAIDQAVSAAAEAAGLDTGGRTDLVTLTPADRGLRLKEIGTELADAAADAETRLVRAESGLAAAAELDAQAGQLAARLTRLTSALTRLHEHEATGDRQQQRAAQLTAARRADPVRPLLGVLAEAQAAADAAGRAVAELAPAAPTGRAGWDAGGADAAAKAATQAEAAASRAERAAAELEHLAGAEANLPGREAALAAVTAAAEAASARVAVLEEERSDLPGLIARLEGEWQQARSAADGLAAGHERLGRVTAQLEAARAAAALAPQVEAARVALEASTGTHHASVDRHQALVEARLTGIAAELASQLGDGEPCPVCGATHHPTKAAPHEDMVSAADVAEAAAARDLAEAERTRCADEYQQLTAQAAASQAASAGRDEAALMAEAEGAAAGIAGAELAAEEAGQLAAELTAARDRQESSAADLRDAERAAAAAGQEASQAGAELTALRADIAAAAQGRASVAERQRSLREASATDRALAAALSQLAASLTALARARQRASHEASALGFADLAQARAAVLDPAGEAALAAEVESWAATRASLAAAVEAEDLAGLDPRDAAAAGEAAAAASEALAAAQTAEREARRVRDAACGRADRFGQRLADVSAAQAACDELVAETEAVVMLAGLAKGTAGHRRVTLTTYVLRHWFGQVVAAANVRLAAMSSGRYELKRTDEGEHRRDRAGLTLAVVDRHTGEERSPASLSGGETFYTSLALALGLADVVRAEAGGIDLDTLFIDEGFGSLDAETLDQVMAVIDDLRDRGRVVGIVSHVADLKERVPERLEVRRLPDGSSATKVVA
jgi:exonuclease SbcC